MPSRTQAAPGARGVGRPNGSVRDLLLRLPKTDIHCHLDGSLRPQTVLELARRFKVKLPADNAEDLRPYVQVAPTCRSLRDFLDVFERIFPILRYPESVERIAYELVEDCARENIRHVEVRLAPELQRARNFSTDNVIESVLKGLSMGCGDFGTTSSVIVCLFRSHGPNENRRAFDTLKRFFRPQSRIERPSVVGIDLAGDEARYPTVLYTSFYDEAKALGIWTTCHAGETEGTENLHAAMALSVHRIGHGIHLIEDQELLREVVRRHVPLEIGISSNIRTHSIPNVRRHPVRAFYEAGVPFTLNTDDRGILGIDLTHEYEEALRLGFTVPELARLSLESIDYLFLPAAERETLRSRFKREIHRILPKEDVS